MAAGSAMPERADALPWALRREGWLVSLAGALAFVCIPLSLGYLGLGWDALNHHIYLGWTAEHARFDRDYLAASYQGYQFPYLYWPVYKLAMSGASGVSAGVVLAAIHALAIPPVWMMARSCIPGQDAFHAGMRAFAVALAFLSLAVLSLFDGTSNDVVASIPLLWAYAIGLRPFAEGSVSPVRCAALSGFLAGVAVAFKLSNGFLVLAVPLLWLLWPSSTGNRLRRGALGCMCVLVGFLAVYGPWGWQLWTHYGSPTYPLYDHWFAVFRGWRGTP